MRTRKTETQLHREQEAERLALLAAYVFQSFWAAKHLPPEPPELRSIYSPEWQLKYQYMLAGQKIAPHLQFEIAFEDSDVHRLWDQAKILHQAGPLAISKGEADFMRTVVLDMATSARLYRAHKCARRRRP